MSLIINRGKNSKPNTGGFFTHSVPCIFLLKHIEGFYYYIPVINTGTYTKKLGEKNIKMNLPSLHYPYNYQGNLQYDRSSPLITKL